MSPHVIRTTPITLDEYRDYLQAWDGIRYKANGGARSGIDCLRFIVFAQDWLHGWDTNALPALPNFPPQIAINNPREAIHSVRWIRDRYSSKVVWKRSMPREDLAISPGDFLVIRNEIYPGHGMICGPMRNTCWHAMKDPSLPHGGCVQMTNIGWALNTGLLQVYRSKGTLLVTG